MEETCLKCHGHKSTCGCDGGNNLELKEYLRRNLVLAKAIGVRAGIDDCLLRLMETERPSKWLLKILNSELEKTQEIINELVKHRDEYSKR